MSDTNNGFSKQVSRGELLAQTLIVLIIILGLGQFTNILAAQPKKDTTAKTASVGPTGATGADGEAGEPGQSGEKGADGQRGAAGAAGLAGIQGGSGARGEQGLTGTAGLPGVLALAYGGLSVTSQEISIETANEWVPIPFNAAGPSSGMNVSTTSPATITVNNGGVCQVHLSVYFSSEDADEGIFTPATYTLGIKVGDDAIRPLSAVYAAEPGEFTLDYSDILEVSANDDIQFYIAASDAEMSIFSNNVTMQTGNTYVMQISN